MMYVSRRRKILRLRTMAVMIVPMPSCGGAAGQGSGEAGGGVQGDQCRQVLGRGETAGRRWGQAAAGNRRSGVAAAAAAAAAAHAVASSVQRGMQQAAAPKATPL
jgi:hypothetical protein